MEPPDETVPLTGRQHVFARLAVALDFLHLFRIGDVVSPPRVQLEIVSLELTLDSGVDEQDTALPSHGKFLIRLCTSEHFGIRNHRFVDIFVPVVVVDNGKHALDRGFRNEYRPDPVVDQPIRYILCSVSDNRRNQNLTATDTQFAIRETRLSTRMGAGRPSRACMRKSAARDNPSYPRACLPRAYL